MPPEDGSPGIHLDPVETWNGVLRSERELQILDDGLIVTHRIVATGSSPVKFQLIDPLPGSLDVGEIGFHPDYEPPHGRIDGDRAVISGVVQPDEGLIVKYGLCPTDAKRPETIQDLQFSVPPSIEFSESIEDISGVEDELETATMTRSSSVDSAEDADSSPIFSRLKRSLWREDESDEAVAAAHGEITEPAGRSTPTGETSEPSPKNAEEVGDGEADTTTGESVAQGSSEGDDAVAAESELAADEFPVAEEDLSGPSDRVEVGTSFEEEPDQAAKADIVPELLRQLETGTISEDERRRLAKQLMDILMAVEETPRSTEVRLARLESKMEAFSAYASALEDIIDEHGPADEFLADVRADIESLTGSVDTIDTELQEASTARDSLDERIEALSDETAVLESRFERISDRLESLRTTHRSKVSKLEGAVEALEPKVEQINRLEQEVAALHEDVEGAKAMRREIVEALSESESFET